VSHGDEALKQSTPDAVQRICSSHKEILDECNGQQVCSQMEWNVSYKRGNWELSISIRDIGWRQDTSNMECSKSDVLF